MMNFNGLAMPQAAAAASMWMHPFVHPSVQMPMPITSTVSTEVLQAMYPFAQMPTQAAFGYGFPYLPTATPAGFMPLPGTQSQAVNPLDLVLAATSSDMASKDAAAAAHQSQQVAKSVGETPEAAHSFVRIPVPVRVSASPALSSRSSSNPSLASSAKTFAAAASPARSLASSPSSQASSSSTDSEAQSRPIYLPKPQSKSGSSAFTTAQTARGFTLNLVRGRLPSVVASAHPREKLEDAQRPTSSELEAIRSLFGHAEAKSRGGLSVSSSGSFDNSAAVVGAKRRRSAPEGLEDSDVDSAMDSDDDDKGSLTKLLRATSSSRSQGSDLSDRKPICQTCSRVCEGWEELVEHQQTHSRGNSHACPICDKAFKRSDHMIIHIRGHTGERPYRCGHCKKCYPSKSSLMRHKRIHNHGLDTDDIL